VGYVGEYAGTVQVEQLQPVEMAEEELASLQMSVI
jgi:hypothetical protein